MSTGIQKYISRMIQELQLEALLTKRDLSLVAFFVVSALVVVLASNVTINLAGPAIMLDVPSAKDLSLIGVKWRRSINLQTMITGSYLFSATSIKRLAGRNLTKGA